MYKNILVPIDGSALSRKAAKLAVRLAKEQNAKVIGFYVAPPYQPKVYADYVPSDFITPAQYASRVKKAAAQRLDYIRKIAHLIILIYGAHFKIVLSIMIQIGKFDIGF